MTMILLSESFFSWGGVGWLGRCNKRGNGEFSMRHVVDTRRVNGHGVQRSEEPSRLTILTGKLLAMGQVTSEWEKVQRKERVGQDL